MRGRSRGGEGIRLPDVLYIRPVARRRCIYGIGSLWQWERELMIPNIMGYLDYLWGTTENKERYGYINSNINLRERRQQLQNIKSPFHTIPVVIAPFPSRTLVDPVQLFLLDRAINHLDLCFNQFHLFRLLLPKDSPKD